MAQDLRPFRLAFLVSHPIQYFSPLFRKIAQHPQIDLRVYYCSDEGLRAARDPGFDREIQWDIPLLEGYSFEFLKNHSPFGGIHRPPFGLINGGILRKIDPGSYDAVVIHGLHYATHWLAFLSACMKKIPVFLRLETPLGQELKKPFAVRAFKKLFYALFKKRIFALAIGSQNRGYYEYYGFGKERIFLMPYAVDNERYLQKAAELQNERERSRRELGLDPGDKAILFCGKLIPKKRPMDLLEAYQRISSHDKALIFVGDGLLRKELERFASENGLKKVFFTGFKNQSELPRYYSIADILVLPSGMGETWGLVVNEAMCFGLPVLVSESAGCAEDLVKDGLNGYRFKTGDIAQLTLHLENLIQDDGLRGKMARTSFDLIKDWNYDADVAGLLSGLTQGVRQTP